jgi:anti-anti-sigma factor
MPGPFTPSAKLPSITQDGDATVIRLGAEYENLSEGELEELKGALLELADRLEPPLVLLDLTHLRFFGSAFIEILFRAWNRLNARGGRFTLCGLSDYCREVVEVTHLDQLWSVFPTRDEAVRAMRQS